MYKLKKNFPSAALRCRTNRKREKNTLTQNYYSLAEQSIDKSPTQESIFAYERGERDSS